MFNIGSLFGKQKQETKQYVVNTPIETKASKANKAFVDAGVNNPSDSSYLTAYNNADLVFSCVSYASDIISQIQIKVYSIKDGEKTDLNNDKLQQWLIQPNPFQSMSDILYLYAQSYLLTGNSYLTFEKVGSKFEGWILDPTKTKIVPNTKNYIDGYIYSDSVAYKADEIVFFKNSVLGDEFYGRSYLTSLVDPLAIEGYAVDDLKSYYANSLVAQGIFSSEFPLTEDQINSLKSQFRALYGQGGSERYGHIIAPNSLKYQPLKSSPRDGMLLEALGVTEERIYKVFRLNPILLGIDNKNNNIGGGTGIRELKKIYINNFIRPIIYRMLKQWETHFRRVFKDTNIHFEADYSTIPEVNTALEEKIDAVKSAVSLGILSQNEGRAVLGYAPIDGELMDSHLAPSYLYGTEPLDLLTGETISLSTTNQQGTPNGSSDAEGGTDDGVSR